MKRFRSIAVAVGFLPLTACGTIMHGSSQDIGISSSPTNAQVTVDSVTKGQTPYVAKLARKRNHIISLNVPGYAPADLTVTRGTSGWVWGNLVFGGLIGLGVDAYTGGLYKLTPDQLVGTLAKQGASVAPTKDGFYVVLVKAAEPSWTKVGQLSRVAQPIVGE